MACVRCLRLHSCGCVPSASARTYRKYRRQPKLPLMPLLIDDDPHAELVRLRFESERRLVRHATTLLYLPSVAFAIVDWIVTRDAADLATLFSLRLGLFAMWAVGLYALARITTRRALEWLVLGLTLGVVLLTLAIHAARPPDNLYAVRAETLLAFALFVVYPNRIVFQLLPWATLTIGVGALMLWHNTGTSGADMFSAISNLVLAAILGRLVSGNRRRLESDMSESLDRERAAIEARERAVGALRKLQGIIPICAYCKNIRSAVGDWHGIEQYVRANTSAEFSHGICPACELKHFVDLPLSEQS